jgi:hypothetical protein
MMMIISMEWDYVSELRPPTGLFFIPQVMYEHVITMVERYWQGKAIDSYTRALCQSYQQSHLAEKQGELGEGMINFV